MNCVYQNHVDKSYNIGHGNQPFTMIKFLEAAQKSWNQNNKQKEEIHVYAIKQGF